MGKPGFAAVEIGDRIGATAQEVNRLLLDQGFMSGGPGVYSLTEKGAEIAVEVIRSSSNLPHAKSWPATYWRENIMDELVRTPEKLDAVRAAIKNDRLARNAVRAAELASQDAARSAAQTLQAARLATAAARGLAARNVLVCIAGALISVGVGYGIYKLGPAARRVWRERLSRTGDISPARKDEDTE